MRLPINFAALLLCLSFPLALPAWAQDGVAVAQPLSAPAPSVSRPASFADLAEKLLPTVVNVSSTGKPVDPEDGAGLQPPMTAPQPGSPFEDFFENYMSRQQGGPMVESTSLGSGFIIDAQNGYIITNVHVVRDAADIRITLHDDSSYNAKIIGMDDKTDIALVKIDPQGAALQAVRLGDSDTLRVGDWIMAIGNPFGLGGTVTAGIVSARSRDINAGPYDDFIQTDASINRGNSGGPMFNTRAELIGINTAIFSPSGGSVGIGFAIPINMAKPIMNQLMKYGKTRRGWLGVKIQTVTPEIADSLGLGKPRGTLIASITEGGPGAKAGILPYDILLSFGGHPINTMRDLPRLVAETEIDKDIPLTVFRDGKIIELTTRLGELEMAEVTTKSHGGIAPDIAPDIDREAPALSEKPPQAAPADKPATETGMRYKSLKMIIAPITKALAQRFNLIEGMSGLVVTKVEDYSDAARKGILPGDIILEIDQLKAMRSQDILDAIANARSQKRTSVLMLIDRAGDERFVAVKLEALPGASEPQKKR